MLLSGTVFDWKLGFGVFGVPLSGAAFVLPLRPAEYPGQPSVGHFGVPLSWVAFDNVFLSHSSHYSYSSHYFHSPVGHFGVPLSRTVFKNCFRCSSPRSARAGSEIHRPSRTGPTTKNQFGGFRVLLNRIHFFTMKIMKEIKVWFLE